MVKIIRARKWEKYYLVLGVIIIVALFLVKAITVIPAGSVGVMSFFGKVDDSKVLYSGIHVINPLRTVTKMSVRTNEYTMSISAGEGEKYGDDSIWALTKEGLNISLDMTVLYHLDPESAPIVYRDIGPEYREKVIRPSIRTAIRDVIARYDAKNIYSEKRDEVAAEIENDLKKLEDRGIVIESMLMRNVSLPDELTGSIEEKLQAEQEAQKMDFVLDKEKKEAERKQVEAEGIKTAQDIISSDLTPEYLRWKSIEMMKELADSPNTTYLFVPIDENGMPIININK